jgi:hypothetical protein
MIVGSWFPSELSATRPNIQEVRSKRSETAVESIQHECHLCGLRYAARWFCVFWKDRTCLHPRAKP